MPIVTKYVPEKKPLLRTWSYEITGIKYKAKLRPPEHTLPKKKVSLKETVKEVVMFLFWAAAMFYFGYGIAKAQDIINMKPPEPVERTPIIEPPPSASADMNIFWRQFAFHNGVRMYNKIREQNATIKNTEAKVAEVNNIAGGQAEITEEAKIKTGSELNRGLLFQELHYGQFMFRNELNAIQSNYIGYLQFNGYKLFYETPIKRTDYKYGLTITKTFD